MSKEKSPWFVVQTQPNKELQVLKRLQAACKDPANTAFLFDAIVPTEKVSVVKHEKKLIQTRKLFPCYVLVQMDLYKPDGEVNKEAWFAISKVQGVLRIAGGDNPRPLKDVEIAQIKEKMEATTEGAIRPKYQYVVGARVRINEGPFTSLKGVVKSFDPNGTMDVSVEIFGRETPVKLEHWQVELLKDGEAS
jgi:transcriptional antiterminator NusG